MTPKYKTFEEAEAAFDAGDLESEYAQFIMDNAGGDRIICNGDTLISAIEDMYLYDSFIDSIVENKK